MKKLICCFLAICLFVGCIQSSKKSQKEEPKEPKLKTYIDVFLASNNSCFDNEIKKEEATKFLTVDFVVKCLGDSVSWLSELPVKFEMLLPYENEDKYVVKFVYSELSNSSRISKEYKVSFQTLSIVDKETASKLKENSLYYISGSCYDYANSKSFTLPSGKYFEGYPSISKWENKPEVNLGTLIVQNIIVKEIPNK